METQQQICSDLQDLDKASMENTYGGWIWMVAGWVITCAVVYGAFMAGYDAACDCK